MLRLKLNQMLMSILQAIPYVLHMFKYSDCIRGVNKSGFEF